MSEVTKQKAVGFSEVSDNDVIAMESASGAHHYGRVSLVVRKTEGAWLYDGCIFV